jgi:5'-nucleotidase
VQLLALNDFHGQLGTGRSLAGRPAGAAAVLASYLRAASAAFEGDTLIVHAGDWVGASPPASGLLHDEPAIEVLNLLSSEHCRGVRSPAPRCNVVGTLGNHEFDDGLKELLRLLDGGPAPDGQSLWPRWHGARFPMVSANVVRRPGGKGVLPASAVFMLSGVRVGVIGAVLAETPQMVVAAGVRAVRFLDEAQAINTEARRLRAAGVRALVLTIHQGGEQVPYEGPTRDEATAPGGPLAALLPKLDADIDVVVSGHAHAFTNARVSRPDGAPRLVTQSLSAGVAFASISLQVDRATGDVVEAVAEIVPTYADAGPGLSPAQDVAALVQRAEHNVSELSTRRVGKASATLYAAPTAEGESPLGNFIADAQRWATRADVALMNQGGMRTDLRAGEVTWGDLYAVQPFANTVITMDLRGAQLRQLLEAQWADAAMVHWLQVSGLRYIWDPALPVGKRVVSLRVGGEPLDEHKRYRVAVNNFLAEGGSGFSVLREGTKRTVGQRDVDALLAYIVMRGGAIEAQVEGRIRRK